MSLFDVMEMRTALTAHQAMGVGPLMRWMRDGLPLYPPSKARMEATRTGLITRVKHPEVEVPHALNAMLQLWSEGPAIDPSLLLDAVEHAAMNPASRTHALAWTNQELTFAPSVRCALVHARLHELHFGPSEQVVSAYARASTLADREGDDARALRGRIEQVRVLSLLERHVEARALAQTLARPPHGFTSRDALLLARAQLHATSMYQRTAALDALSDLLESPYPAVRHATWRTLLVHTHGDALSAPERDRMGAMAARTDAPEALRQWLALQALDATASRAARVRLLDGDAQGRLMNARLRAILDGGTAGPRPTRDEDAVTWLSLHGFVALRARRTSEARQALLELDAREAKASVAGWTFLRRALREPALAAEVATMMTRWLGTPGIAPARGFRDLALALVRMNQSPLATKALQRAVEHREPDARQHWMAHQRREAWLAYTAPSVDRAARTRHLHEARTLLLSARPT